MKSYGQGSQQHQRALQFEQDLFKQLFEQQLVASTLPSHYLTKSLEYIWREELPYQQPLVNDCPFISTYVSSTDHPAEESEIAAGCYEFDEDHHHIQLYEVNGLVLVESFFHEIAHAFAPPSEQDASMHHGHTKKWLETFIRLILRFSQYNPALDKNKVKQTLNHLVKQSLKKNSLKNIKINY